MIKDLIIFRFVRQFEAKIANMLRNDKKKKNAKDSDEEEEIELGDDQKVAVVEPTGVEKQAIELADVPTIPESEVSPAAYIF